MLDRQPDHAAARWNRALALRDLGLLRGAAEDLRALAGRGEPGWSAEATARADALDREADARAGLADRMLAGGAELVQGGAGFSLDDARAMPGLGRLFLYDAIRTAPTRERVLALRPLADALDENASGTAAGDQRGVLARAVERAAGARFAVRGPLARTYAELANGQPPAARGRYLAALRASRQHDILIGALIRLGPDGRTAAASDLPELARLAHASGDPWFELLAAEQEARVHAARGDLLDAEAVLLRAREQCRLAAIPYRCVKLAAQLVDVYVTLHRFDEARRVLAEAWAAATGSGGWLLEQDLLPQLADLHVLDDDALGSGLALTRAYAGELVLRNPDYCGLRVWAQGRVATVLINQLRIDDARRELAAARPPGQPCTEASDDQVSAFVGAHVLRAGGTDAEVAALRADIARQRADTSPARRAMLDHVEGRLLIDRAPAEGQALLAAAIRAGDALPGWNVEGRKARAYSYSVLTLDAARRGDAARAMALLAEESGLPAPRRCALGVAVEDRLRMVLARGPDGSDTLHFDADRDTPAIDPAALVPRALVNRLAGCPVVNVLARPPVHGVARLLPDGFAWRYRAARSRPLVAAPPVAAPPGRGRRAAARAAGAAAAIVVDRARRRSQADRRRCHAVPGPRRHARRDRDRAARARHGQPRRAGRLVPRPVGGAGWALRPDRPRRARCIAERSAARRAGGLPRGARGGRDPRAVEPAGRVRARRGARRDRAGRAGAGSRRGRVLRRCPCTG